MSTTKRLTRHEMKEPDQVLTTADRAIEYTRKHPRRVGVIVGVVLVLGLAGLVTARWSERRAVRDSEALTKVLEVHRRPVAGSSVPARPGVEAFVDDAARDSAILAATDAFLAESRTTATTRAAKLLQAEALTRRGRYADAVKRFSEVAGTSPSDVIGAAAVLGRASAQADAGEPEQAVAELRRLASAGRASTPKPLLLERAAVISENSGRTEEALALYRLISEDDSAGPSISARAKSKVVELEEKSKVTKPTDAAPEAPATQDK